MNKPSTSYGSITIFSAVVLSGLLLFSAVLIDYARMAVLHKVTEDAARSGVRSALSAYDNRLYERYGLFGRGGTDSNDIFEQTVQANLGTFSRQKGTFKLVQAELQSAHIDNAEVLGKHEVFSRQVLEEMKYKAPVDFALELASKFAPLSGVMKEATVTVNMLEELRKLYDKREEKLAAALQLQRQAAETVGGIAGLIPTKALELATGTENAARLAGDYAQYANWVMTDQQLVQQGKKPKYSDQIEAYAEKARGWTDGMSKELNKARKQHDKLQQEAVKAINEAKQVNADMQRIKQETANAPSNSSYDRVTGKNVAGVDTDSPVMDTAPENDMQEIRKLADELILPDGWFAEYNGEIADQATVFASLQMEAGGFITNLTAGLAVPNLSNEQIKEGAVNLRIAYEQYEAAYVRKGSSLDEREQKLTDKELKKERQAQEAKAGELWSQARRLLHGMTSVPQSEEHLQVIQDIEKRYKNNLLFNQEAAGAEAEGLALAQDAHEEAEEAASAMSGLFGGIADMLEQTRDSVYLSEYTVSHFASFAPQNLRALLTSGDTNELAHAVAFSNQEAEYVIYGFHSPTANLAAAYGELIGVRMAIRTMEGLSACRVAAHPLLILSCSVAYGLEKTMEDMAGFTERGAAPLSKYINVDVAYTDYLRLFMLVHGGANRPSALARMIAVIEHNDGVTLSKVPTALTGEIKASARLWFLPGVMDIVQHFGSLQGKVVGGKYETVQTIGWSY
ncbi:hypothetical protein PghCCS26_37770 [Paenibacillus glycanilyticus]|uniref:Flp pilus-assembly TadG-like N-terminal domain-containing protein n=1 Tax=Paenibacillus glycanilyticus TaxID=126569 RepID=A0ABQ6NNJ0_9BACL|nr:hypothetical protein [Paenibacillus glycanilyticus]GMK46648.1 hypothetical protein PghCCS26_37770 [Paenibacillus glycanilyticus]